MCLAGVFICLHVRSCVLEFPLEQMYMNIRSIKYFQGEVFPGKHSEKFRGKKELCKCKKSTYYEYFFAIHLLMKINQMFAEFTFLQLRCFITGYINVCYF